MLLILNNSSGTAPTNTEKEIMNQTINLLQGKDEISNLVRKIVLIRDQCYILFLIHENTTLKMVSIFFSLIKNKALLE